MCVGVGVRVCIIGTRCRYEAPCWVTAWHSWVSSVCLSDPWTPVTSHLYAHFLDRCFWPFLLRWRVHILAVFSTRKLCKMNVKTGYFMRQMIEMHWNVPLCGRLHRKGANWGLENYWDFYSILFIPIRMFVSVQAQKTLFFFKNYSEFYQSTKMRH